MLLGGCVQHSPFGAENRIWPHGIPPASATFLIHPSLPVIRPQAIMSTEPSASASQSNYLSIFNAALENYKHKTKTDLTSHPLLPSFQSSNSAEAILTIFLEQIPAFRQVQNDDDVLIKWVIPTVIVLCSFSDELGQVSIKMFPPNSS
jgi:hypothetical protein